MQTKLFRRMVVGALVMLVWLSFIVKGSYALLFDNASLGGNTISTGSVNLLISTSPDLATAHFADTQPGFSDMLNPGQSVDHYFYLKNTASFDMDMHILMKIEAPDLSPELVSSLMFQMIPVTDEGEIITIEPSPQPASTFMNSYVAIEGIIFHNSVQKYLLRISMDPQVAISNLDQQYDLLFKGLQVPIMPPS